MLQQPTPDDFVIATGEMHTVREFATAAFARAGITLTWRGAGEAEEGVDSRTGKAIVKVDPRYFRPTEVQQLLGDASKARQRLGWSPRVTFAGLVEMMVDAEVKAVREGAR